MSWASLLANVAKLASIIAGMVRDAGLRRQGATEQVAHDSTEQARRVAAANRARIQSRGVPDDADYRD